MKKTAKSGGARRRLKTMICTYLEPEQVTELDRLSRVENRPKAEIIREAVDRYIARAR
jgi:predicted DNA-binding protein